MSGSRVRGSNDLGAVVVARTAQGHEVARGEMISYCDAPTVTIDTGERQVNWRADLCELLTTAQAADYWRGRAKGSSAPVASPPDAAEGPQLLPCPFCGGEPYVHEPDFHGDSYQIGCECDGSEDGCWRDGRTLAEAVFRWNERHPGGPDG